MVETTREEDGCEDQESPVHTVTLTRNFYMGVTEVTQGQWEAVMGSNPSTFSKCGADCPVEEVSWQDAVDFANALSELDGLEPAYLATGAVYPDANGYRLPTEAEWEYAARGGGDGTPFAGSDTIAFVGWVNTVSGAQTHEVAGLFPNGFGLHDMSGNVWEWCEDKYEETYYTKSPEIDPPGATYSNGRVSRGGSYLNPAQDARVSNRRYYTQFSAYKYQGFRLAKTKP